MFRFREKIKRGGLEMYLVSSNPPVAVLENNPLHAVEIEGLGGNFDNLTSALTHKLHVVARECMLLFLDTYVVLLEVHRHPRWFSAVYLLGYGHAITT